MARTGSIERMEQDIEQLMKGKNQPSSAVQAKLTGRVAELWQRARAAMSPLEEGDHKVDDGELIGLLLTHALPILEVGAARYRTKAAQTQPSGPKKCEPGS